MMLMLHSFLTFFFENRKLKTLQSILISKETALLPSTFQILSFKRQEGSVISRNAVFGRTEMFSRQNG